VEEEYFPPPPELRELLRGLEVALAVLNGAPSAATSGPSSQVLVGDRTTVAADVLERLTG
jgi:hypothetical protein